MYDRPVGKKSTAFFEDPGWVEVSERGKLPRPDFRSRDGRPSPAPDVYDLVLARELSELRWRLGNLCMAMVEPTVSKRGSDLSSSAVSQGELLSQFSELWEFLSGSTYASGKPRLRGSLSLRLDADGVKVTLTDPSTRAYCTRSGKSLDDTLLALEVALKDGSLKWLPSSFKK